MFNRIKVYLAAILCTIILSCTHMIVSTGVVDGANVVYTTSLNVFKRVLILYPELNSAILSISYDMLDDIDKPKNASLMAGYFTEITICLSTMLDHEEMERIAAFADSLSRRIPTDGEGTFTAEGKEGILSLCKAMEDAVMYIRQWRGYAGKIPRGYKI